MHPPYSSESKIILIAGSDPFCTKQTVSARIIGGMGLKESRESWHAQFPSEPGSGHAVCKRVKSDKPGSNSRKNIVFLSRKLTKI